MPQTNDTNKIICFSRSVIIASARLFVHQGKRTDGLSIMTGSQNFNIKSCKLLCGKCSIIENFILYLFCNCNLFGKIFICLSVPVNEWDFYLRAWDHSSKMMWCNGFSKHLNLHNEALHQSPCTVYVGAYSQGCAWSDP